MVKEIIHDPFRLSFKSTSACADDIDTAKDLLDTLIANADGCVGMAANMIGVNKNIIVFAMNGGYMTMFNPVILRASSPYETEEGCLSLSGKRKTKRFRSIRVQYQDELLRVRIKTFEGFTAQIIQHEIDHINGILI